jgi:hypothetical protein
MGEEAEQLADTVVVTGTQAVDDDVPDDPSLVLVAVDKLLDPDGTGDEEQEPDAVTVMVEKTSVVMFVA